MATIVSSILLRNDLQTDGSRIVIEQHEDDLGNFYTRDRTVPDGTDVVAEMLAYAAQLPTILAGEEEQSNLILLFNGGNPADLVFNWSDPGDEVKLVCVAFMQASLENAIPLRPTVSGYTNSQITAFFTAQERNRIQGHAGELLAIEAQISQWNADKEVLLGIKIGA